MKNIIGIVCLLVGFASVAHTETVTFESIRKTEDGKPLMLTGELHKPEGTEPFPAIILLHGAGGMSSRYDEWVNHLLTWGYVVLQLDSFGPRGISSIAKLSGKEQYIWAKKRARDPHEAMSYLVGISFVDSNKISLMGWSHGGITILNSIKSGVYNKKGDITFRAAVAFYPYCHTRLIDFDSPLLILTGELDDWCPADLCLKNMPTEPSGSEVRLKIYPDAHHGFDYKGYNFTIGGHQLKYNPDAAADSVEQVNKFLSKYMQ